MSLPLSTKTPLSLPPDRQARTTGKLSACASMDVIDNTQLASLPPLTGKHRQTGTLRELASLPPLRGVASGTHAQFEEDLTPYVEGRSRTGSVHSVRSTLCLLDDEAELARSKAFDGQGDGNGHPKSQPGALEDRWGLKLTRSQNP